MSVQQELELRLKGHQQSTQLLGKIARDPPKTLLICTKHAHTFSEKTEENSSPHVMTSIIINA